MSSYLRQKCQSLTPFSSGSEKYVKEEDLNSENREEIERSKIGIILALVQAKDPFAKDVDELMIRGFLGDRDLDVEKASATFLKYLKWRREIAPNGFISPSEIPNDLAHNKLFMQGYDKTGHPLVVIFAGRHKPTALQEFKRYVTFALDKICARTPSGREKFTAIGDLGGWGYANSDIRGYGAALSILQDCYPERLSKLFLVNVPLIFMTAWKMVRPFIRKATEKKIIFVAKNKMRETLLRDIDKSQLPTTYGGALELVPIQEC